MKYSLPLISNCTSSDSSGLQCVSIAHRDIETLDGRFDFVPPADCSAVTVANFFYAVGRLFRHSVTDRKNDHNV